jgi:hypothetical protein
MCEIPSVRFDFATNTTLSEARLLFHTPVIFLYFALLTEGYMPRSEGGWRRAWKGNALAAYPTPGLCTM